ncbi:cytochrome P450 [Mycena olivaceomarginata]|nr:cytochrome P450 [Mycena olivaceomarginata]
MNDLKFLVLYGVLAVAVLASFRKAFHDRKFLHHAPDLIQRGYDQYAGGIFRVAHLFRWEYVVCSPKLIKDIAGAPDNVVSFAAGVAERRAKDPYHHHAIRTTLTRNLHACFPDVKDEIVCAFNDVLRPRGSECKALPVLPTMMVIVARVSNRLFVGLPLCDFVPINKVYLANNVNYTIGVNDFISWLLDFAEGEERAALPLTVRILVTNMAAIHTSSTAFTYALFDLTTYPEYLLPMREEAERVVKEEGWTKAALNGMVEIDSFGNRNASIQDLVQKYDNAAMFDGFRFARERAEHLANHNRNDNQDIFKRHMISTAVDHLPFGTGKHACPGRFFTATELKATMASLIINYDVQAEVEDVRPANKVFDAKITPSATWKVCFRKRQ